MKQGTIDSYADYVLCSGGERVCVVEVKRELREGDDDAALQGTSYASALGCAWVIVTDGRKLLFYAARPAQASSADRLVFMEDLQLPKNTALLARNTLDTPEAAKTFERMNLRHSLEEFLKTRTDDILAHIVQWIESTWTKGAVDRDVVFEVLQKVFGGAETEEETSDPTDIRDGLAITTAGDWREVQTRGKGCFQYREDTSKIIDVRKRMREVERDMAKYGLRTSTRSAMGGFYWTLRRKAGLLD